MLCFFVITSFICITWHYRFMSFLHIDFMYFSAFMLIPVFFFEIFLKDAHNFFLDTQLDQGWSFYQGKKHITSTLFVATLRKVDFVFTPLSIYLSKHEHLGLRKGWDRSLLEKINGVSAGGFVWGGRFRSVLAKVSGIIALRWIWKMPWPWNSSLCVLGIENDWCFRMGGLWGCNKNAWTEKTCVSVWLYSIVNLIFFLRIRSCSGQLKSIWPR